MLCSMMQNINEIREAINQRIFIKFLQCAGYQDSHLTPWRWLFFLLTSWLLRVWIRLYVRKRITKRKSCQKKGQKKKKTQMLTSYHLLIGLFLKNLLKVLCWPVPPPLGVRMWEKKPHWLTHETHYQKLSILTVKATEAICTLLRSLLHFDNCFSPWTVEF